MGQISLSTNNSALNNPLFFIIVGIVALYFTLLCLIINLFGLIRPDKEVETFYEKKKVQIQAAKGIAGVLFSIWLLTLFVLIYYMYLQKPEKWISIAFIILGFLVVPIWVILFNNKNYSNLDQRRILVGYSTSFIVIIVILLLVSISSNTKPKSIKSTQNVQSSN